MKIERINENSIRCTLTSFDLSVRNMNLKELAYGTDKARKLFSEMMSRASSEVGFNAENTPIMIEAIPMSSDSIQLVITKVSDPEELDTRFSRFSQNPAVQGRHSAEEWISRITNELLEGAGTIMNQIQKQGAPGGIHVSVRQAEGEEKHPESGNTNTDPVPEFIAYSFDTLDDVLRAASGAAGFEGRSSLYRTGGEKRYILVVFSENTDTAAFSGVCNMLSEYGRKLRTGAGTLHYYSEHYTLIAGDDALRRLSAV